MTRTLRTIEDAPFVIRSDQPLRLAPDHAPLRRQKSPLADRIPDPQGGFFRMYSAGSRQLPLWEGSYRGLQRKMRRKVPSRANKKDLKCFPFQAFFGPSDEIRTHGPLNPIQVLYQTELHPDVRNLFVTVNYYIPKDSVCQEAQVLFLLLFFACRDWPVFRLFFAQALRTARWITSSCTVGDRKQKRSE